MVEADPDVPHAFAHVVGELPPASSVACALTSSFGRSGESMPVVRVAAALDAQQAAVRRIEVEEQAVLHFHRL